MVPAQHSIIVVEEELPGARAWAERQGVSLDWTPDTLELRAVLTQPKTGTLFHLRGVFDGYPAIAPAWTFADKEWGVTGRKTDFPKPAGATPFGNSIFIINNNSPVICAPFNRLAYAQHQGPHPDWGGPANWRNAGLEYVRAETVGDMLHVIHRDLEYTDGRMDG